MISRARTRVRGHSSGDQLGHQSKPIGLATLIASGRRLSLRARHIRIRRPMVDGYVPPGIRQAKKSMHFRGERSGRRRSRWNEWQGLPRHARPGGDCRCTARPARGLDSGLTPRARRVGVVSVRPPLLYLTLPSNRYDAWAWQGRSWSAAHPRDRTPGQGSYSSVAK